MRLATLSALLVSFAICPNSPSENQAERAAQLEFTVTGSLQTAAPDTASVARVSPTQAEIEGVISTPNPCYQIEADLVEEADSLTVRLTATRRGGMCIQVLAAFTYDARISDLPPGTYTIAVVHTYPSTGWEERTFLLRAEVP